jgi:mono/diheme cytochrome c family protein
MVPMRPAPWMILVVAALASGPASVRADEPIPFDRVAPLFQKHCHGCHGSEKAKGDLRIDKLNPDFIKGSDGDHWRDVLDRLNFGDMPPAKAPPLAKEDRERMTTWLNQERRRAALAKNQPNQFRRLTRREYERTLQDLLGLPIEYGSRLPEDGRSKDGFRNDGDALRMSPLQYETYLQIADEALAEAIVTGPAPVVHRYRVSVGEKADKCDVKPLPKPDDRPGESFEYGGKKEKSFRIWSMSQPTKGWDGTLAPSAIRRFEEAAVQIPDRCVAIGFQQAFRKGETRIKVRVARIEPKEEAVARQANVPLDKVSKDPPPRFPSLTVAIGSTNYHGVELKILGEPIVIDHADYRTYDYRVRMENVSVPNPGALNDRNAAVVVAWNSASKSAKGEKQPPLLKIEWIELESPFLETWPPATHTNILFANTDLAEPAYAREVVRRFSVRAYRGPVAPVELDRLMNYWTKARATSDTLEASLKETLGVVLSSPRFLGLPASRTGGAKDRLTDHELASRISYLLWSTMPDETLLGLADQKKLSDPAVLNGQIRRMIQDPKAWAFIEQFAEQWLDLERLQRVSVRKNLYPGYDDALAAAMRMETISFFGEVLRGDLSIFQFLDSDFTCVNETLAAHYGIAGVVGPQFRKVPLEPGLHRGGVLTHASVLTGNSDGRDGHPIKRGMWLLKNLFDETPPPPPPNVPELNRETNPKLKNLTIPQALAVHRDNASCVGCHRKIDPWGIAFEEYDAVGNWMRDGTGARLRKARTSQPIESTAELPSGVKVAGMRELQDELIRTKADDFRRTMLRKVMAYALGRSLTLGDIDASDAMVTALRDRNDRLPALIELIAASEPFRTK